ncbi:hypothetical protein MMC31_007978 [Peltigera leucophlebia]|nr:hypothetical protein [Peltigera leucophlebia]
MASSNPPFLKAASPLTRRRKSPSPRLGTRRGYDQTRAERHFIDSTRKCKVDDVDLLDERLRNRVPLTSQQTGLDRHPPDASGARNSEDSRVLFKRWIESPCRPDCNAIVIDSTGSLEKRRDYILERISPPTGIRKRYCNPEVLLLLRGIGCLEPSIAQSRNCSRILGRSICLTSSECTGSTRLGCDGKDIKRGEKCPKCGWEHPKNDSEI